MLIKHPLLLDFPLPITTRRLMIRPVMPGNGKQIFEAIDESREVLSEWNHWVEGIKSWKDSEATAREFYEKFISRKEFSFAVFKEDRFVGICSYHTVNWTIPSAHMGYWCRLNEQRKGYMREAIAALTQYAFQHIGLRRLAILCDDENVRSAAIPEALGFTLEVTAKGILPKPGTDELRFSRRYVRFDAQGLDEWRCGIEDDPS